MSVSEFIAAAEQADLSLKGEGKAQAEIQQVAGEVEALAKDIPVSMLIKWHHSGGSQPGGRGQSC